MVYFISVSFIILFVLVYVFEVIITGALNEIRSMLTGWFAVEPNWAAERYVIYPLITFAVVFALEILWARLVPGSSVPGYVAVAIFSILVGSAVAWFVNRSAAKALERPTDLG